jgi:hypothetical protein
MMFVPHWKHMPSRLVAGIAFFTYFCLLKVTTVVTGRGYKLWLTKTASSVSTVVHIIQRIRHKLYNFNARKHVQGSMLLIPYYNFLVVLVLL